MRERAIVRVRHIRQTFKWNAASQSSHRSIGRLLIGRVQCLTVLSPQPSIRRILTPFLARSVSCLCINGVSYPPDVCSISGLANIMGCKPTHVYGVVVVLASFLAQLCVSGIVYSVGVFYVMFLEHMQGQRGTLALVSSLNTAFFFGIGRPNPKPQFFISCLPLAKVIWHAPGTEGFRSR